MNKSYSQTIMWVMAGPIIISCTFLIVAIRPSHFPWFLALAAIVGLILSYQWKWKGMAFSIVLLVAGLSHSISANATDWMWYTSISAAISATFIIAILTLEEAQRAWDNAHSQSEDQGKTISVYPESLQQGKCASENDQNVLQARIEELEDNLTKSTQKLANFEKLILYARDDLEKSNQQHQKFILEIEEGRKQIAKLQADIEISAQKESLHGTATEEFIRLIAARDSEIAVLKGTQENQKNQETRLKERIETLQADNEKLLSRYENERKQSSQAAEDHIKQKSLIQQLEAHIEIMGRENQQLESSLEQLQEELNQFANLEAEHSNTLKNLKAADQQVEQLTEQLSTQQASFEDDADKQGKLHNKIHELEIALNAELEKNRLLSNANQDLTNELQSLKSAPVAITEPDTRELRRVEGLYNQLREQFSQKSITLDSTRHDLFEAHEKLAAANKEFEEFKLEKEREFESQMSELLESFEEDYATGEKLQKEIDHLHEVINTLMH